MSKQSRAKSRARRKNKGTGTAAVTFEQFIRYMPEPEKFCLKTKIMDELHKVLCDRRTVWGGKFLGMFYCHLWTDLEDNVAAQRPSINRTKALELIAKVKAFYNYYI